MTTTQTRTLEDAIRAMFDAGVHAPVDITKRLIDETPRDELVEWMLQRAYAMIYNRAHCVLRAERRNIEESALRPHGVISETQEQAPEERRVPTVLVPGEGWVPMGSLDAEMCDALADHYKGMSGTYAKKSRLYHGFAVALRKRGAAVLGELFDAPQIMKIAEAA